MEAISKPAGAQNLLSNNVFLRYLGRKDVRSVLFYHLKHRWMNRDQEPQPCVDASLCLQGSQRDDLQTILSDFHKLLRNKKAIRVKTLLPRQSMSGFAAGSDTKPA